MLSQGRPLYLRYDEMKNAGEFVRKEGIRSAVAIPVFNKGEVIGCYTLASHTLEEVPKNIRPLIESIVVEVGIAIVHGQTQQILKESQNELYRLFNTIDDLVFVLDRNTRILRTNQAVLETLGYSHEELQKMNISDLCQPKERGGIIKSFSGIYDGKKDFHSCTFITKSGKKLPVETHTTPGHWNNTDVIFAISRDMTERIRTENAIRNINSKLNLLSSITRHDILNQITALSGIIFLIQKIVPDDPKIRKYVGLLKDISDTIQEQVTFTRDYQDLGVNCPAWQRVKPLFEKVKADDPFTDIELAIDTGHLEIFADPMLERVFFNLIDNAVRHGQHVTKMSVTFHEKDGEGIVVVQDNGAGIPANIKKDVFEKGFGSNTGLGLFLTKEILEITGISIEETGAKGQGAKFLLHIPAGEWR
ncbi:MAG: PAS domain S-box protein, partial [Methanogenium sp.]|nr:PAS domain S-box protein [Methanogenium sp.]